MFASFASGNNTAIHPNLRDAVYAITLRSGGKKEYETLRKTYFNVQNQAERDAALQGLGCSVDTHCLDDLLALLLSDKLTRVAVSSRYLHLSNDISSTTIIDKAQQMYYPMQSLRKASGERLWTWLKDNWAQITAKLGGSLGMLGTGVQLVMSALGTSEHLNDAQAFFSSKENAEIDMYLAQSLDALKAKIAWVERDRVDVAAWLEKNGYET